MATIQNFVAKDQHGAKWEIHYTETLDESGASFAEEGLSPPIIQTYTLKDGRPLRKLREGVYETFDGSMRVVSPNFK